MILITGTDYLTKKLICWVQYRPSWGTVAHSVRHLASDQFSYCLFQVSQAAMLKIMFPVTNAEVDLITTWDSGD